MITITATVVSSESGDVVTPSQPIPDNAVLVVFDGSAWTVYEPGDELPESA